MVRFSFLSKLLMALAVGSAILNLLTPGFRTYYGLQNLKTSLLQVKFSPPQKPKTPQKPKNCESEYDRLVAAIAQKKCV